jgi:RNA polymerase sigma-70 factor (ECF subfamily)
LRAVRGVLGANHPDVEDITQEAAVGLIQALPTFRAECTVLHFACRIAVLTALAARRQSRARPRIRPESFDETECSEDAKAFSSGQSPVELLLAARRRAILRDLCDQLPPAQSEVLVLHCVLGYTVEQVAEATQTPRNTVRSRLRLAKEALRERIRADADIGEALESRS